LRCKPKQPLRIQHLPVVASKATQPQAPSATQRSVHSAAVKLGTPTSSKFSFAKFGA